MTGSQNGLSSRNEAFVDGPFSRASGVLDWPDRGRAHRIAVLAPMSGAAGLWGPSCISCAQMAIGEANARRGINGRQIEPIFLNSDSEKVSALERDVNDLIENEVISAIVGMSISIVRQRLNKLVRGRVPHVFTPLFEGQERSPNVYTLGETPAEQLKPAIRWLATELRVKRWALIGNDYVWPRASNAIAKESIIEQDGVIVSERYLPFDIPDPYRIIDDLMTSKPEIIFLTLVGQDAVAFNRAFGERGLDRRVFRFSTAIEENVLLATGAENTKRLFATASYFEALSSERNLDFKERYLAMRNGVPPALNTIGQSVYEGINFYTALQCRPEDNERGPISYASARGGLFHSNDRKENPTYLARADGVHFRILETVA